MPSKQRTDQEVVNMAKFAVRMADMEVAAVLAFNAANPDARPKDAEYWRCAGYYSRTLLRAHRRGEPIKPAWVEAIFDCSDAMPED
jgi:hypothetical protein